MIIEPIAISEGTKDFQRVTKGGEFWYCVYNDDLVIVTRSVYDEEVPLDGAAPANNVTDFAESLNGFGADTHAELETEITNRGLTTE